eukprot:gene641-935_t
MQLPIDGLWGTAAAAQQAAPAAGANTPAAAAGAAMLPADLDSSVAVGPAVIGLADRLARLQLCSSLLYWDTKRVLSLFQAWNNFEGGDRPARPDSQADSRSQQLLGLMQQPQAVQALQQFLLENDVRGRHGRNVLHLAATCSNPEQAPHQQLLLDLLLGSRIFNSPAGGTYDCSGVPSHTHTAPPVLSNPAALLNKLQRQGNNNGATPLIVAATGGVVEVFQRLLQVADLDVLERTTNSGEMTDYESRWPAALAGQ